MEISIEVLISFLVTMYFVISICIIIYFHDVNQKMDIAAIAAIFFFWLPIFGYLYISDKWDHLIFKFKMRHYK